METQNNNKERSIPWKIYLAHTLSTWGDNMWWFAGGLYMMKLAPGSLRLTALYGLIIAASVICFGASVGNWIDKTRRLTAARTFLAIQNLCVSICALGISCFLWVYGSALSASNTNADIATLVNGVNDSSTDDKLEDFLYMPSLSTAKYITIVGVIFFSSVARLASSGTVIILQKDWIVVISDNDTDYLASMNSILRTIELTTYMLAPVIAGQLFYFIGYMWTGIFIAIWNILSVICEYGLLNGIYHQYPRLAQKITKGFKAPTDIEEINAHGEETANLKHENNEYANIENIAQQGQESSSECFDKYVPNAVKESFMGWQTYFDHPVRNAGLGLSLLYMTVLGFDNITYGYAIIQEVPEPILGVLVAISALVGVVGSTTYPIIRRRLGLERTGLLGMFLLVSTSTLSVVSIFIPGSPFINWVLDIEREQRSEVSSIAPNMLKDEELLVVVKDQNDEHTKNLDGQLYPSNVPHITLLMTGIILARFGLWIVDLTITQILQERVEEERRGIVNGVQDSLNNSMDLLKCVLVILLPGARDFGYLIILSYISISLGWVLYATFSKQQRGHLFHFCRLIPCNNPSELPANSHWPFLPERDCKQPTFDCDEMENLRTAYDVTDDDREDSMKTTNDPIIKNNIEAKRLQDIIDCKV